MIDWPGGTVSGWWADPRRPSGRAVLLAHGAGAGQDHPGMTSIRDGLVARGHPVLTFNYPYTEAGRRFPPDRRDILLACHRAAAEWLRDRCSGMVMAGRSMGGRMASYLAAEGEPCDGLVLYAYPLHPAGSPTACGPITSPRSASRCCSSREAETRWPFHTSWIGAWHPSKAPPSRSSRTQTTDSGSPNAAGAARER